MTIEVTKIKDLEREITVSVPKKEVQEIYQKAYKKLSNSLTIKGFRQGKIPKPVIDKQYKEHLDYEVKKTIIPDYYTEAIKTYKMAPATEPSFVDINKLTQDNDYQFKIIIEIEPEFSLPTVTVSLTKQEIPVTQKQIEILKNVVLSEKLAYEKKPTDSGIIENTDRVLLDVEIKDKETIKTVYKNRLLYYMGSEYFPHQVESALVGMKYNEKKEVTVDIDENVLLDSIANIKGHFILEVQEIASRIEKKFDTQFFQSISKEINSEKEFLEHCSTLLNNKQKQQLQLKNRDIVKQAILKELNFPVPKLFVQQVLQDYKLNNNIPDEADTQNEHQNLAADNSTKEIEADNNHADADSKTHEHIKNEKGAPQTEDKTQQQSKKNTDVDKKNTDSQLENQPEYQELLTNIKQKLQFSFFLAKYTGEHNIKISDDDVAKRFIAYAMEFQQDPKELIKQKVGKQVYREVKENLLEEQILDSIILQQEKNDTLRN